MLATQCEDLDSDLQQPRKIPGAAVYHDLHHSWKGYRYKVHRGFLVPSHLQFSERPCCKGIWWKVAEEATWPPHVCTQLHRSAFTTYIHPSHMLHTCARMTSFLTLQILFKLKYNYTLFPVLPPTPTLPKQNTPLSNSLPWIGFIGLQMFPLWDWAPDDHLFASFLSFVAFCLFYGGVSLMNYTYL